MKHPSLLPLYQPRPAVSSRATRGVDLLHVRREENTEADTLVNTTLDAAG